MATVSSNFSLLWKVTDFLQRMVALTAPPGIVLLFRRKSETTYAEKQIVNELPNYHRRL